MASMMRSRLSASHGFRVMVFAATAGATALVARGGANPVMLPLPRVLSSSLLQGGDSQRYASKTLLDGKEWMTENLRVHVPDSYCYGEREQNCEQYGRLYTWQSAREACRRLGQGWHLPSNEEWRQMARHYGGVRDDSGDEGRAAYRALRAGGRSGFEVMLGGGRVSGGYARLETHGLYWTASEVDSNPAVAWFYNFGKGSEMLNRHEGEKDMALSVRCVGDVEKE